MKKKTSTECAAEPKAKHTPTPWALGSNGKAAIGLAIAYGYRVIGEVYGTGYNGSWSPEAQADAEFVVRAVNEYDDLKSTEIAYKEACTHRKELLTHNTRQSETIAALLEALKVDHRLIDCGGKCPHCKLIAQTEKSL
jgi:hypothetical protein